MEPVQLAAILAAAVVAASVLSVEAGIAVAKRADREHAPFITLLMSTGLTFGTISSLYGLNAGIIDGTQFSLLVTVVVLSAIVPTAIAQGFFSPIRDLERREEAVPAEEYV